MIEFADTLSDWTGKNHKIAMARVISTWGSSPRPAGSMMFINDEKKSVGSVSGGCVEGEVVKRALTVIKEQQSKVLDFGVSDEDAWTVGLTCGGSIRVFIQPVHFTKGSLWAEWKAYQEKNEPCILISSLADGPAQNLLLSVDDQIIGDPIPDEVTENARSAYNQRSNRIVEVDEKRYFIQLFPRKPLLLVIGAAHIAADLVELANTYGFETIVIDPRGIFAQKTVFRVEPSQMIEAYPSEVLDQFPLDAYTFCAILSHDPKIDDNALEVLLPSEVAYIGALGSRKTHAKRIARLEEKGVSRELIDRIQAPIGVDINAKSACEIALSVMGEIIRVKNSGGW